MAVAIAGGAIDRPPTPLSPTYHLIKLRKHDALQMVSGTRSLDVYEFARQRLPGQKIACFISGLKSEKLATIFALPEPLYMTRMRANENHTVGNSQGVACNLTIASTRLSGIVRYGSQNDVLREAEAWPTNRRPEGMVQ